MVTVLKIAHAKARRREGFSSFVVPVGQDACSENGDRQGLQSLFSSLSAPQASCLDTIELTNYLRTRFDAENICLLDESWGSTLGVLAVQQRPNLYQAWIASGQMVSQRATDRFTLVFHRA